MNAYRNNNRNINRNNNRNICVVKLRRTTSCFVEGFLEILEDIIM